MVLHTLKGIMNSLLPLYVSVIFEKKTLELADYNSN